MSVNNIAPFIVFDYFNGLVYVVPIAPHAESNSLNPFS